jgi:hypothetical protein
LAVLAKLDAGRPQSQPGTTTGGGLRWEAPQATGPPRLTGAMIELSQHFDIGNDMAEAITAALSRHGLIYNDPPGLEDWGLTEYGRNVVEYLHGIETGTDRPHASPGDDAGRRTPWRSAGTGR